MTDEVWIKVDPASGRTQEQLDSLRRLTLIVYILYLLSWFAGITALVAIIINYVKREDAAGTVYESHFRWQIRTFWWSLLWGLVGVMTLIVGIGFLVLIALTVWVIYRFVKGLLYWNDRKALPT